MKRPAYRVKSWRMRRAGIRRPLSVWEITASRLAKTASRRRCAAASGLRGAGGIFNVATKSGTNKLHGSVFEFLRNDNFDANRWEADKAGLEKPEFKRNQFGFSLGGPIKRDRTFFFGTYEGLRERLGVVH